MDGTVAAVVAVSSDRALVAEAITAALVAATDLEVVRVPWADSTTGRTRWEVMVVQPAMTIMLCDLDPGALVPAQRMAHAYPGRCLLLTDAPRGPLWGALLEAGVVAILPSSISLDDLVRIIESFLAGTYDATLADREDLVTSWHDLQGRRAEAGRLLATLSERELGVLQLLRSGLTVQQIAESRGVAPSTVRSQVRSILRKLHVHSQLAAVALLVRADGAAGGPLSAPHR